MSAITSSVVITLEDLKVEFIKTQRELDRIAKNYIGKAFRQGQILIQLKDRLPHGNFEKWCDENLVVKASTRRQYMLVAKRYQGNDLPDVPIKMALGYTRTRPDLSGPTERAEKGSLAGEASARSNSPGRTEDSEQRRQRALEEADLLFEEFEQDAQTLDRFARRLCDVMRRTDHGKELASERFRNINGGCGQ